MAKDIDTKIDELAAMVANGFSEVSGRFDTINERLDSIEETLVTKVDKSDLEKFVGVVRQDYDGLAARVKNLEKASL